MHEILKPPQTMWQADCTIMFFYVIDNGLIDNGLKIQKKFDKLPLVDSK